MAVAPGMRTIVVAALVAVAGLGAAAPAQERPQPDEPPARLDPQRQQAIDPARFQIQDFSQLRPVRPETSERDPRLAVIDWSQAAADRREQLAANRERFATAARGPQGLTPQVSERSRERIRPVHMPVLLPLTDEAVTTRAGGEAGMMLVTRAYFYDASYHLDGMSVHVGGTRLINHRGSETAQAAGLQRDRGADGVRIVTNESGRTADFTRYGAAYTVTLECVSAGDPRCADDTYLRALLGRLVVAGGNPEGEG